MTISPSGSTGGGFLCLYLSHVALHCVPDMSGDVIGRAIERIMVEVDEGGGVALDESPLLCGGIFGDIRNDEIKADDWIMHHAGSLLEGFFDSGMRESGHLGTFTAVRDTDFLGEIDGCPPREDIRKRIAAPREECFEYGSDWDIRDTRALLSIGRMNKLLDRVCAIPGNAWWAATEDADERPFDEGPPVHIAHEMLFHDDPVTEFLGACESRAQLLLCTDKCRGVAAAGPEAWLEDDGFFEGVECCS